MFTHSSINGHLGCFCVLAIVKKAAKNISRRGVVGSNGNSVFNFFFSRKRRIFTQILIHASEHTPGLGFRSFAHLPSGDAFQRKPLSFSSSPLSLDLPPALLGESAFPLLALTLFGI